jgi:hypothetical protein
MVLGSVEQRRARLVRRHLLDGTGTSALEAAEAVVALHATEPATVYLSVLARCPGLSLADVARELYAERTLVRLLAMRRTLFVVPGALAPVVHHAASLDVAARIRKRLVKELATATTEPAVPADVDRWLDDVIAGTESAVESLGVASGAQLGRAEPRLRTAVLPTTDKKYDVRRTITSQVLVLMGAEGRLVRGEPMGSWTSRQHTWTSGSSWWPDGLPPLDAADARARLVEVYLRRFGPATEADLAWWTGWPLGHIRKAVATLDIERVGDALVLADDTDLVDVPAPSAVLLPALDPTPMGWKQRDWFLPRSHRQLYDSYGNIGPTVWWGGEVVGGWATRRDGTIATRLLLDRGAEAERAVQAAVEQMAPRLEGAVIVPTFRSVLERELSTS